MKTPCGLPFRRASFHAGRRSVSKGNPNGPQRRNIYNACSCTDTFTHWVCCTFAPEKTPISSMQSR